jgi:hypothetical protein
MRHDMRAIARSVIAAVGLVAGAATLRAQAPADPATRLKQVLPASAAARVLGVIADARARDLPASALENRALKFAAKGVDAESIVRSVAEQEARMERAREALRRARPRPPSDDEIEAGAEAIRKGVDGTRVSALARMAPADRSIAVALYAVGGLVDRGMPSDSALAHVEERLANHASDQELEKLPVDLPSQAAAHGNRPTEVGRDLAETKHPGGAAGAGQSGSAAGPPANVPANGGRPATPPGLGKKPPAGGKKP